MASDEQEPLIMTTLDFRPLSKNEALYRDQRNAALAQIKAALDRVDLYQRISWITPAAADDLRAALSGDDTAYPSTEETGQ